MVTPRLAHCFPRGASFPDLLDPLRLMEPRVAPPEPPATERHLQCVWYDGKWRPTNMVDHLGRRVEVVSPGRWNLEAGPDFLDADLEIAGAGERLRGDVEIHVRPADWRGHGHAADPNYARVVAHVCYDTGVLPEEDLPAGCVQIGLKPCFEQMPNFAFEAIDVTAYPYEVESRLTPLARDMATWSRERKESYLDAAGEARLLDKAARLARAMDSEDAEQVLYAECMAALGYKHNRHIARELARRLPAAELREAAGPDPETAYALLLGMSGLMPVTPEGWKDAETAALIRRAWDIWWKRAAAFEGRPLPADAWRLGHTRPSNHPRRRLMAAAHWFTEDEPMSTKLAAFRKGKPRLWCRQAMQALEINTQTYWTRRLALDGGMGDRPISLVGTGRARAILVNVLVPFAAATEQHWVFERGLLEVLPAEPVNSIIRETAHALFGPDHPPALYRTGLRRQGLIHLFHAYGLGSR